LTAAAFVEEICYCVLEASSAQEGGDV